MYTGSVPPEHKSAYTYMHSLVLECALEFPNTPLPMIGLRFCRLFSQHCGQGCKLVAISAILAIEILIWRMMQQILAIVTRNSSVDIARY